MESWIYVSEGKAFGLPDELIPPADALMRTKEVLTTWDLKSMSTHDNSILVPSMEIPGNQGFMELGFHDSVRRTSPNDSIGSLLGSRISDERVATSGSSCSFNQKILLRKEESNSNNSCPVFDSRGQDSSLMDLKLGRLTDYRDSKNSKFLEDSKSLLSVASTVSTKRIRTTSLNGQTPYCQVHGCNMDLSSSKDYHKKHKVCEVHSKTAKVIVNGIEQRFCQQCSRFHLLGEFDDGKRSCRKRLAGHNERRRKPQLDSHSGGVRRLLQSYHDGRYLDGCSPGRTSFFNSNIFLSHEMKYDHNNWLKGIKLGDDGISSGQLPISDINRQLPSKNFLPYCSMEEQPSINGSDGASGNVSFEYRNPYEQRFGGYISIHNTGSINQGNTGVTDPGCALSLLSSQSQDPFRHSSANSMARPLILKSGHSQCSASQFSDKLAAVGSEASTSMVFSSSGTNSGEEDQMGLSVFDASSMVEFEVPKDVFCQGSWSMSMKEPSSEHGQTVNLLQLSSLLQGAEQRRLVHASNAGM